MRKMIYIEYIVNTYNQNSYGMRDGILKFQNPDSMRNEDRSVHDEDVTWGSRKKINQLRNDDFMRF